MLRVLIPAVLFLHLLGARVGAGEEPQEEPETAPAASYVGARLCMRCHYAHHKSWSETAHARATEALRPGRARERKTKAGLDPDCDFTRDRECLRCHTTGFGRSGGYPAPPPAEGSWAAEETERAKRSEGVGCESCHGAGGRFWRVMDANPRFRREAIVRAGAVVPVDEKACLACHADPCAVAGEAHAFDFERDAPEVHTRYPLRYPH